MIGRGIPWRSDVLASWLLATGNLALGLPINQSLSTRYQHLGIQPEIVPAKLVSP